MVTELKRILIGKPLDNVSLKDEKYNIRWGLPILSSDAISSVAYAGQEMLMVMIPVIGLLSYHYVIYLSLAIIILLTVLMLSYRQTIECYPNGGGAYIVAKENLGVFAGVTAGAALSVDYIMTVAVSVSSGVDQLCSAFTFLRPFIVPISIGLVALLMLGNLRGIRESSKFFGIPAYLFIFAVLSLIVVGFFKYFTGVPIPKPTVAPNYYGTVQSVGLVLILRAFSNGCTALTGVEAVSNAVPNFKEPSTKNAKTVLLLLSIIILLLFGGTSFLANIYHATPGDGQQTVLIQMADMVFGRSTPLNAFMFYFITAMLFLILALAANTAFSGFPMLVSVMANEGFVPRQLKMRGDRLSYSNGIIILSIVAALLIIIFNAQVSKLMGLYAVGVFISFTLSQTGMIVRWFKTRGRHWHLKVLINGAGAVLTALVLIIISITKFHEGAWIVVIVIPILIFAMLKVKKHYVALAKQLKIRQDDFEHIDIVHDNYRNRIIVPIQSVNKSSVRALRYARTISHNITAFSVAIDEEGEEKIRNSYSRLKTDIPLTVVYSPFRRVVDPLLDFIESEEYNYQPGDMITVILPQFSVKKWWQKLLHNGTGKYIERQLLKHKHIVVATIPLQLQDDDNALRSLEINPEKDNPWNL